MAGLCESAPARYYRLVQLVISGFRLLVLLACGLFAQTEKPAAEPLHQFAYPSEHFSIAFPPQWKEVDQDLASRLQSATALMMPNAPKLKFNHVYTSSDVASHLVIINLTQYHYTDAYFKDLERFTRTASGAVKSFLSGGILQDAQSEHVSYDSERHVLWAISKVRSVFGGELRSLNGLYITKAGTIYVGCTAPAADFEKYQAECQQVINSVKVDPEVQLTPPVPISQLLSVTTEQANSTYRRLVERVKGGDFAVDFRELRMACARSDICEVRATTEELAAMSQASREQRSNDLAEICQRLIDHGFINIEAHVACSQADTALNRPEQSKFHMDVMSALLQSIINAGDGKTDATAYEVISVREQYDVLASRSLPYFGQALRPLSYSVGGHRYERWDVKDPKTQETVVIIFNTDAVPQAN